MKKYKNRSQNTTNRKKSRARRRAREDILEISDDELREEIAREAEEHLGMTYEEFVEAHQQGTLPDELVTNELAMLLRFVEYSSRV